MDPDNFHLEITNLAVSSRAELGRFQRSGEIPRPSGNGGAAPGSFGDGGARIPAFALNSLCRDTNCSYILVSLLPRQLSVGSNIMEFCPVGFRGIRFGMISTRRRAKKCPAYLKMSCSCLWGQKKIQYLCIAVNTLLPSIRT